MFYVQSTAFISLYFAWFYLVCFFLPIYPILLWHIRFLFCTVAALANFWQSKILAQHAITVGNSCLCHTPTLSPFILFYPWWLNRDCCGHQEYSVNVALVCCFSPCFTGFYQVYIFFLAFIYSFFCHCLAVFILA